MRHRSQKNAQKGGFSFAFPGERPSFWLTVLASTTAIALTAAPAFETQEHWRFLYRELDGETYTLPRSSLGYPTEDACRAAARVLMPLERRFWTDEEQAASLELRRQLSENRRLQLDALIAEAVAKPDYEPGTPIAVPGDDNCDDVLIFLDAEGKGGYKLSSCDVQQRRPMYLYVESCAKVQ